LDVAGSSTKYHSATKNSMSHVASITVIESLGEFR
jgi:hypothetical protein